ncbi:cell division protein FtsL [Photobacterium damselae subsp. damselae]|uniref:cell division protein FtsL n=1 Tax=Photobacterium damselae TaxID=38293 RepID=UPI000A2FDBA4|nr:cell division protein FtsL [Photobacterium damselae]ARR50224.1 cell division protein FtsL [Photobacterium damselae subsp. damselae]QAY35233.1 cell division protein FtsL [Photobacterium damselae subsp. damselae]QOQ68944.1 cell division protein FtsL [Photobacterium damselae subsp. damselae]
MNKKETEASINLSKLIGKDLITVGCVPLVLAICILASALGVVLITHQSRQLISQQEQLLSQRDQLDIEWRNQLLEENALAEHSRIERLAEQELKMERPTTTNEVVIK